MVACKHVGMAAAWLRAAALSAALSAAVLGTAPAVSAIPCAWCATEWTQLLNNVELLGISITEANSLRMQFEQFQVQLRQAERLRNPRDALALSAAFGNLVRTIETARGVSLHAANVDDRYREEYGGFGRFEVARPPPETLSARYRGWSEASHQNVRAALRAAGLHAAAFYDEQATLRALERQAVGADGMLAVAQAGAQIAAMQVEEGRKLRALLTAQMQMQGNLAAVQTERQAASDAAMERLKRRTPIGIQSRPIGIDELRR